MIQHIIFGIIALFFISAVFLAWYLFHQAKTKERLVLFKKGMSAEEINLIQERRKVKLIFPWLKLGIVITAMSVAFLVIGCVVYWMEHDLELLKGFIITFVLGFFLGASFLINHFISENNNTSTDDH